MNSQQLRDWERRLGAKYPDSGIPYTAARVPLDPAAPLPISMKASDATAMALVKHGPFAADLIAFDPGGRVNTHTHPGAHILYVLDGEGTVEYADGDFPLEPGTIYLVPSNQPHAIQAKTRLRLLSIADDHKPADSTDRLTRLPDRHTGEIADW